MSGERTPRDLLPLTPATFHILLTMATEERHGYAVMHEVEASTDGQIQLSPGTLYSAIKRLRKEGLIEESDERPDPTLDDERRRYYRLTPFGAQVARAESQRLAQAVRLAQEKNLLGPGSAALPAGEGA